jgi:hypothetical protein
MATYYVAESNSSDTPSRDGSLFQPWRTITYALARAGTGDTILVRSGTYAEGVTLSKANTTLQAYSGETVWIDHGWDNSRPPTASDWSKYGYADEYTAAVNVAASGCTVDGINVRNAPGRGVRTYAANTTIKNLTVDTCWGAGIIALPQYNSSNVLVSVADDCLVQDCKIIYGSLQMKWTYKGLFYPNGCV